MADDCIFSKFLRSFLSSNVRYSKSKTTRKEHEQKRRVGLHDTITCLDVTSWYYLYNVQHDFDFERFMVGQAIIQLEFGPVLFFVLLCFV